MPSQTRVFETYENQRCYPWAGYSADRRLATDRWAWSNKDGTKEVLRKNVHLPSGYVWESDWTVHIDNETDRGGWGYAFDFRYPYYCHMGAHSWVRRRRWVRNAVPIPPPVEVPKALPRQCAPQEPPLSKEEIMAEREAQKAREEHELCELAKKAREEHERREQAQKAREEREQAQKAREEREQAQKAREEHERREQAQKAREEREQAQKAREEHERREQAKTADSATPAEILAGMASPQHQAVGPEPTVNEGTPATDGERDGSTNDGRVPKTGPSKSTKKRGDSEATATEGAGMDRKEQRPNDCASVATPHTSDVAALDVPGHVVHVINVLGTIGNDGRAAISHMALAFALTGSCVLALVVAILRLLFAVLCTALISIRLCGNARNTAAADVNQCERKGNADGGQLVVSTLIGALLVVGMMFCVQ